jgi:signal peptidase I
MSDSKNANETPLAFFAPPRYTCRPSHVTTRQEAMMGTRACRRRGDADCRRLLDVLVLLVCGGALLQAFGVEPFHVPTGSMAPALLGHHRVCPCPRCGMSVTVGRTAADRDSEGDPRHYARAFCPNCGEGPLPVSDVPETAGDHVLVNRAALAFRRPRRWEVVVFRLFGVIFVKRIVGLPGEELLLRDGDVYVDGKLARKTFAQAWAMRVPIFDQDCRPPSGWDDHWLRQPARGVPAGGAPAGGDADVLDGRGTRQKWTFCNGDKCLPLRDEYAYNAGLHGGTALVHDFLFEADVEVLGGTGTLSLRLCDGHDWVETRLPTIVAGPIATRVWPMHAEQDARLWARRPQSHALRPGQTHRVVMAFVDRRVTLSVDGRCVVENVDLPAPKESSARSGVGQPVQLEATDTAVQIRSFRLYRDIHYSRRGRQAVGIEPVRLGEEQYFVLGDNSANSEDSRFWPVGAVSEAQMLGPAFLVHLASRPLDWHWAGRLGQCQVPDLGRIRWIR